jgi:hypothetical protein
VTTKTSYQELNVFAFGDGKADNKGPTWNQPFPVEIPPFPSPPQLKSLPSTSVSDRRLAGRSFAHLPPLPPSRTYLKIISSDSKESNDSNSLVKKRKHGNDTTEETPSTALSSQLREKKIIATKNIQKTLTRLDTMLNTSQTTGDQDRRTSDEISQKSSGASSTVYCGPSLPISSSSSHHGAGSNSAAGHMKSSHHIVLDENCELLKGLSKEERLLMGLAVTGPPNASGAGGGDGTAGEPHHHHNDLDDER